MLTPCNYPAKYALHGKESACHKEGTQPQKRGYGCQKTGNEMQDMSEEQSADRANQQQASKGQGSTAVERRQAEVDWNLTGLQARQQARASQAKAKQQGRIPTCLESLPGRIDLIREIGSQSDSEKVSWNITISAIVEQAMRGFLVLLPRRCLTSITYQP